MPVERVWEKEEVDREHLKATGERKVKKVIYCEVRSDSHNTIVREPTEEDKADPQFKKLVEAFLPKVTIEELAPEPVKVAKLDAPKARKGSKKKKELDETLA